MWTNSLSLSSICYPLEEGDWPILNFEREGGRGMGERRALGSTAILSWPKQALPNHKGAVAAGIGLVTPQMTLQNLKCTESDSVLLYATHANKQCNLQSVRITPCILTITYCDILETQILKDWLPWRSQVWSVMLLMPDKLLPSWSLENKDQDEDEDTHDAPESEKRMKMGLGLPPVETFGYQRAWAEVG